MDISKIAVTKMSVSNFRWSIKMKGHKDKYPTVIIDILNLIIFELYENKRKKFQYLLEF